MQLSETEKRDSLLKELRRGLFSLTHDEYSGQDILQFCNIPEATLWADIRQDRVPFGAVKIHYFILGLRALRAIACGRIPDGTVGGSPQAGVSTPPLSELVNIPGLTLACRLEKPST